MADSIETLRRQLGATSELKTVVRAMKAISASGLVQYEKSVTSLRDYSRTVEMGLRTCLADPSIRRHVRTPNRLSATGIVLFGSDQGLVGQFNENLADYFHSVVAPASQPTIWAVGERLAQTLEDKGFSVTQCFVLPNSIETVSFLIRELLVAILKFQKGREQPELRIFQHSPMQMAACEPTEERILPIDEQWIREIQQTKWPTPCVSETIGSPATAFDALLREYIYVSLFRACVESLASENASRLQAMQRAEKNIDELSADLTKRFHQLRQSSIDEELFDVVAGFESIGHGKNRR